MTDVKTAMTDFLLVSITDFIFVSFSGIIFSD